MPDTRNKWIGATERGFLVAVGSLLLVSCDQTAGSGSSGGGTSPVKGQSSVVVADRKADELRRINLRVANSELMRPIVVALYDPNAKSLHEPTGKSLFDQIMGANLTTNQSVEFAANREKHARQLADNEAWMMWALDRILRESGKEPTNAWKMLLLQGPKCGLSENESRLFVEGR